MTKKKFQTVFSVSKLEENIFIAVNYHLQGIKKRQRKSKEAVDLRSNHLTSALQI